jgi:citrate lyase gamma subunit
MTTTSNGCLQKSYYNAPTGVSEIQAGNVEIKVFPNPTSEIINLEISSSVAGNFTVDILNMLGQKVASQAVDFHKASIGVAQFPAGAYLIDCYRDGVKMATTRFIKN